MTHERGKAGVVCGLRVEDDGSLRIILDDVEIGEGQGHLLWRHRAFFTSKSYAGGRAEIEALPDSELAEFGFNVLARLLACHSQYGKSG